MNEAILEELIAVTGVAAAPASIDDNEDHDDLYKCRRKKQTRTAKTTR